MPTCTNPELCDLLAVALDNMPPPWGLEVVITWRGNSIHAMTPGSGFALTIRRSEFLRAFRACSIMQGSLNLIDLIKRKTVTVR